MKDVDDFKIMFPQKKLFDFVNYREVFKCKTFYCPQIITLYISLLYRYKLIVCKLLLMLKGLGYT